MKAAADDLGEGSGRHEQRPESITVDLTPRQSRLLTALVNGPVSRNSADTIAGASNSPEVVRQLRAMGLGIWCERIEVLDRDGYLARPGIYHLQEGSRQLATLLLARRG